MPDPTRARAGRGPGLLALLGRFLPLLAPFKWPLAAALTLAMLAPLLATAVIGLLKLMIDEAVVPRDLDRLVEVSFLFLALGAVKALVDFADGYASTWLAERFLLDLKSLVHGRLVTRSVEFHAGARVGDLLTRLTTDAVALENLLVSGSLEALRSLLTLLYFGVALVYLSPRLALVVLLTVPLFALVAHRYVDRMREAARRARALDGEAASIAEEALANVPLVQALDRTGYEARRFRAAAERFFAAVMRRAWLRSSYAALVDWLPLLGTVAVFWIGTYELIAGRITLGSLLAFVTYLGSLYTPVRALARLSNQAQAAGASAERLVDLLAPDGGPAEAPDAVAIGRAAGHVVFDRVTFAYRPGRPVLSELSFEIRPGEMVALVGPSGVGKSTVVKLLLRLYDPTGGAILLDGRDIRTLAFASLRAQFALVLQDPYIFDGTVRENLRYGRLEATDAEIERAARLANAHEFIEALPQGYDTPVGPKGVRLSGGQQQRLAIARALLRDAPILVLDEATSSLDAESEAAIQVALERLTARRTTLVIAHRLSTVRRADRILVLNGGRIVEAGTHEALLAAGGLYRRLYERQLAPREAPAAVLPAPRARGRDAG
ncbi:MAG TPA: ABC transporter ATP-binding protein [Thermodesulfobacteriota bacterium]|nr:ABC transporter ATP-binding protein [Thermodesulfobacteriota bacterium]